MALYLFRDFTRSPTAHLAPQELLAPWSVLLQARRPIADASTTVQRDEDNFRVNLDVQQFAPDDISVKVVNGYVVVEGQHEEKRDEHGFISRRFVRRYALPDGYDLDGVSSKLSSDGVLSISAPRNGVQERMIPVTHTGPCKSVKDDASKSEKK